MESDARRPEKLRNIGSMDRNWNRWKNDFLIYMKLTGGINKREDEKAAWLKNLIGPMGLEALEAISFDNPDDRENMTIIMEKLEEHFDPPKNEILERNKFFLRSRKNNESIDAYIDDLKVIAKLCNFEEQTESLVRDVVIFYIKDKHLRNLIFEEKDLDLDKLKSIYKNYEIRAANTKVLSKEVVSEEVKSTQKISVPKKYVQKKPEFGAPPTSVPKNHCRKCGTKHPLRACPAFGNICCYCNQLNHFWYQCPTAESNGVQMQTVTDTGADKGYRNNSGSFSNVSKEKIFAKQETVQSDPLVKNFAKLEPRNPKNVHNQFPTRSNQGMQKAKFVQHPQNNNNFQSNDKGGHSNYEKPPNYNNSSNIQRTKQPRKTKEEECVIS